MNSMNYKITNNNNKWIVSIKTEFNTKEEALEFIAKQDENLENNTNTDIDTDIDNVINEYIEKTDNKSDYVTLKNVWYYVSNKLNLQSKKDFFNIIKKHSFYGKYYKQHNRNGSNLLLGFKYKYDNHLLDENTLNELFNDEK